MRPGQAGAWRFHAVSGSAVRARAIDVGLRLPNDFGYAVPIAVAVAAAEEAQ